MTLKWREIKGVCPACGHGTEGRGNYCTVTEDGAAILCRRNSAGKPIHQRNGAEAWLFRTADVAKGGKPVPSKAGPPDARKFTTAECIVIQRQLRSSINPRRLAKLSDDLGVSVRSLEAFGVGWYSERAAWTFPMYDGALDNQGRPKPCGFRTRESNHEKRSIKRSREGIFIPEDFVETAKLPDCLDLSSTSPLAVLTPEGPTDCAAARDLGFRAIGRPNNIGGADQIARLLISLPPQDLVIVGEWDGPKFMPGGKADFPGIGGALRLGEKVCGFVGRVRFMMPPKGVKDLRAWLPTVKTGDVLALVARAYPVNRQTIPNLKKHYQLRCDEAEAANRAGELVPV